MKKNNFVMFFAILIFFIIFFHPVSAITSLISGNNSIAPVDNLLLNFTWSNSTFIGVSGTDYNATLNITFNLPSGMSYIAGNASTNMTGNLSNITSNDTTITFGNSTDDTETPGWFAFNISSNASGVYTLTVNETYDINGTSNYIDNITIILNINKAATSFTLYLNGTENNKSYTQYNISNFTAVLNISGKEIHLSSNYTNFTTQNDSSSIINNLTNLSSLGFFNLIAYWDGDGNYSASNETYYFDTTPPQYSIIFPDQLDIYGFNKTYWFNISWSDATLKNVWFEFNSSTPLFNKEFNLNSSGLYWINETKDYPAGNYTYKWCANDSLGNVNCTNNTMFNITRQLPVLYLNRSPSSSIYEGNSTIINCTKSSGDLPSILTLFKNGSSVGSSGPNFADYTSSTLSVGVWNFTCTINGSQNYSSNFRTEYLTVNSVPVIITPTPTPSGSFTLSPSSSSITIEPNSSGTITLTLRNTYSYNITKINITVSGINASWYSLSKVNISVLQKNGSTDTSILTLNIPEGAERKSYSIIASAVGRDSGGSRLTRQTSITLIVPEETPQNVTNETNETESFNNTGIGNQTNQTNVTGFSINLEEFKDYIVLLIALVSIVLIFIFRNEFTGFIRGKRPEVHPEHKIHEEPIHKEPKKIHRILSHVKKKISSLSEHRLVIQIKKKEKEEKA